MKSTVTLFILLLALMSATAQDKIGISFTQNFSTLRFLDSENEKEDLDYAIKYGYGISYQLGFSENFFGEGSLFYNSKGANSTLDLQKLDWSMDYINASVNGGYRFILNRLVPHFGVGVYYGRLMKADQFIGSDYYDMMSTDAIGKNDLGVNLFAGLDFEYSTDGVVFIRLTESMGLLNLENNQEANQKMFNRTFSIQLGLNFIIK